MGEFEEWKVWGQPIHYTPRDFNINEWVRNSIEEENEFLKKELEHCRGKVKRVKLPTQYIINDNATILFWDKNKKEKTIVKRSADDEFNARLGFLTAFFQHYSGMSRSKANKYLANLKVEEDAKAEKPEEEIIEVKKAKIKRKKI